MIGTSSPSASANRWTRAAVLLAVLIASWALGGCGSSGDSRPSRHSPESGHLAAPSGGATSSGPPPARPLAPVHRTRASGPARRTGLRARRYAVGERVLTFVDRGRLIRLPGRPPQPRRLVTVIRYPEHVAGPFPLVVFGHGFAVTPAYYFRLLRAWAQAGYVVAAPVFPLENAHAPGGPDEADIVNQPRDMSFVITRLLALSAGGQGPLAGLIDPRQVAVSGQSDGGETAVAVAYDSSFFDRRVRAAIILSGAVIPGGAGFQFPYGSPPLLATQGTVDTINPPRRTYAFFALAPRPKYLLKLLGAGHLPPYTSQQPQLAIVERVTIAFLDRYLKGASRGIARMIAAGDIAGRAQLVVRR